ncbi:MAG: phosphopeptide-binding protein [Saprospiraceae bacterium]|nr:phosphopeptide-binding protein [Saprospiraceae bacterium]
MRKFFTLLFFSVLFLVSCQPAVKEDTETTTAKTTAEEAKKYVLKPFETSTQYLDAAIEDMTYKNGKVKVAYKSKDYVLGNQTPDAPQKMCANAAKGQHIHFIVNNAPYDAYYTNEFDTELPDGEHIILAFLSRSYHESLKNERSYMAVKATVEKKSFVAAEQVTEPMLFYSRPKGKYIGKAETEKVMLDFFVTNLELGDDYRVKVEINGEEEHLVDAWQPYYIEGLPMGDNKIKLTLIDKSGNPIETPLNPVERVFTLEADPAETAVQ